MKDHDMKRKVYLAVEATGLDTDTDRLVEIVALEAIDSKLTGQQFQVLLDPGYTIEHDAELVTGYDNAQLEGLPSLGEMASAFLKFVKGAELITFNARWTFNLIDAELARLSLPPLSQSAYRQKDARSLAEQLNLNVRLSLDKLAVLFDCQEPVQSCSQTWRDCYLLAQVFPRLAGDSEVQGMNIVQLEASVPIHDGPWDTQYIEIATISEPWRSQFIRWFCAGELVGDERIHRCHRYHWKEWLTQAPAQCPELAPAQLDAFPFVLADVRDAMRQGYQRAQSHLEHRHVHFHNDLEREMRYQAALATYGEQEKTLQEAYIRGFRKGLKNPNHQITS